MNRSAATSNAAAYDVVIVGGGMVGSLLACALGDSSLKVAVIEPNEPAPTNVDDYDPRVSALTLASRAMLDALGVWPAIARRRFGKVIAMRVWEGPSPSAPLAQAGEGRSRASGASRHSHVPVRQGEPSARSRDFLYFGEICFDAADIGEPYLAFIVENSILVSALHERLRQYTNIRWLKGTVGDIERREDSSVLRVGERILRARLVVAADGANSAVRQQMRLPVRVLELRQQGIVATVRTERAHDDTAWQKFLPSGPLAFLPLSDPHASSIVWSADTVRAEGLLALEDAGFSAAIEQAVGDRLGAIRTVGRRAAFPLALAHAERYVEERVALVGDAAHTVHPLAGQGVNLGLLDAAALAEVLLAAAERRRDIGRLHVLRRYERWRKGDNLAMIAVTGGFKFLFGNDLPFVTQLRHIGLSATNRVTMLKNLITRRACGLTGDLPQLARRGSANTPTLP